MDSENSLNALQLAVGLDSEFREEVIELLMELHADVNCPGRSESVNDIRPLHMAAMWGYDLTVKLLLYHEADASLRDSKGLSPVDYASIFDNYSCISILLRYGCLNSTASAWSAIMDSSLGESTTEAGADADADADDNSFDERLFTTALDLGGDDKEPRRDRLSVRQENLLDSLYEDEEYDPLDLVREDELDLEMENRRLRFELKRLGRNPGPITGTTKRLYAKLLVHLIKEDKQLVYSPKTKEKSQLNGYSVELNSILTGKFSTKQAIDLEREFIRISGTRDYHGPKQFFNYILIDPRISNNLPDQVLEASDSDTSGNLKSSQNQDPKNVMGKMNRKFNPTLFTKFIESIFYIGKGQKKRDLMHLYDALADRGSITQKKIDRIRSIWDDGFGVVSLHIFHNITSKEALTREAIMIETIGLRSLTNLLKGTIQFRLGWNEHKRRLLGTLLLHRAYTQFLNEGERQLKREDLKLNK